MVCSRSSLLAQGVSSKRVAASNRLSKHCLMMELQAQAFISTVFVNSTRPTRMAFRPSRSVPQLPEIPSLTHGERCNTEPHGITATSNSRHGKLTSATLAVPSCASLTQSNRNGVFGGIIINGPASSPYDEDLGTITLNDWYHETPDALYSSVLAAGPPNATSGLINGTGVYKNSTGIPFRATFEPGKKYRLRIINSALSAGWKFMIDNHDLTVISTDFVPIVPYNTTSVNINMGQRYDVIVRANQSPDINYCEFPRRRAELQIRNSQPNFDTPNRYLTLKRDPLHSSVRLQCLRDFRGHYGHPPV